MFMQNILLKRLVSADSLLDLRSETFSNDFSLWLMIPVIFYDVHWNLNDSLFESMYGRLHAY